MLELKKEFTKLESELMVCKNITDNFCKYISIWEQKCQKNEYYV